MTKALFSKSIYFCIFLIIASCSSNEPVTNPPINTTKTYPLVDEKLWPFFEQFEAEAKQRGFSINLVTQQIQARIEPIPAPNVGLCNRATNNRVIVIDQDFWENRSELKRELLVFHELGHCSLNLEHREDNAGGICNSIMRSGHEGCVDNYSSVSRAGYLDELFIALD